MNDKYIAYLCILVPVSSAATSQIGIGIGCLVCGLFAGLVIMYFLRPWCIKRKENKKPIANGNGKIPHDDENNVSYKYS